MNRTLSGELPAVPHPFSRMAGMTLACWWLVLAGCGRSDTLTLASASGIVTYRGKPLPNASVTFIPQDGSLPALATTDQKGWFSMRTQGENGAFVGSHAVVIIAIEQTRELTDEEFDRMTAQQLAAVRRSLIPKRYGNRESSGLIVQVAADADLNEFVFDLQD